MVDGDRPLRSVAIPDHLWECFLQMARDMGSDHDSLISQALFSFARLNGYSVATPAPAKASRGKGSDGLAADRVAEWEPPFGPSHATPPARTKAIVPPLPPPSPPPAPAAREVAEASPPIRAKRAPPEAPPTVAKIEPGLYLVTASGSLDRVKKDRFVIGRGKHCDLVLQSGKVSREHAAVVNQGGTHFIEDLGSANGTWFNKQRIRRRKIEDGDEYLICNEKVKFALHSFSFPAENPLSRGSWAS